MKKSIAMFLMVLLLAGCTNGITTRYAYEYKGESALWTAEFVEKGELVETKQDGKLHFDRSSSQELIVTYKNDLSELSKTNRIIISYETPNTRVNHDTEGPFDSKKFTLESSGSAFNLEPYDHIVVAVSMDGVVQEIELVSISTTKAVTQ